MQNRRQFLTIASAAFAAPLTGAELPSMTAGVTPITQAEREARIDKARRLMNLHRIGAIVLEGGTSMYYFTGTRWGNSERTFALVIPQKGDLAWVVPGFEEQRAVK